MTKWEALEGERRKKLREYMHENGVNAYDLVRMAKEWCRCGTCRFFIQHYTKDGDGLDWGHCDKGNVQHSKKQSTACCGFWEDGADG